MSALRAFIELLKQGAITVPGPAPHVGAPAPGGAGAPAPGGAAAGISTPARTLTSITIYPEDPTLFVGEQAILRASGTFSDGNTIEVTTEIVWSSSRNGVVSIDYTGTATPHVPGDVVITASDPNNPAVSASTNVTAEAAGVLQSIEIFPDAPSLVGGEKLQFMAEGTYSDGRVRDVTTTVKWSSSAEGKVSIDSSGIATPKPVSGIANIIATDPNNELITASITATVEADDPLAMAAEEWDNVKREAFADMEEDVSKQPPDKARDRRFVEQINKVAAVLSTKPPDKAALKELVKAGNGKVLDMLVKNLPDPPDRATVSAAIQARFNIKMTNIDFDADDGAEGNKSIKLIYTTLMKVPEDDIRLNKSVNEIIRRPGESAAYYDTERKQAVFPAGRADEEGDELGNSTTTDITHADGTPVTDKDGHVIRLPAELVGVEENCKPKGTDKPKRLAWAALHEVGHGVDDDTGAMDSQGGNDFAGWREETLETVAKAAAAELHYDETFIKHLLTDSNPDDMLKPHDATEDQQRAVVAWCKAVRVDNNLWQKGAECEKHALNKRVFHEAYPGEWVSYKLDARKKGITGYQFRSRWEWFAELYAAYYSNKLKDSHPQLAWIKKF